MKRNVKVTGSRRLGYLRTRLIAQRQDLIRVLRLGLEAAATPAKADPGDTSDEATRTLDQETVYSITQMGVAEIRQIDEALERMDEGIYGKCAACGREIPLRRLLVMPFAAHCVKCQEHQEYLSRPRGAVAEGLASWERLEGMPQDMPDTRAFVQALKEERGGAGRCGRPSIAFS